ncbi:PAS domain-containing protein [Sulfitobacter sp. F26169L]|uniref:PAS domain-containing protein n=1 Tax=Sulfitobacter sp. F26169L TaxID=2996015 RepID=UPI002260BB0B|nr:PAS domain-containing protein [Sulfitobacter sp. F26169L]MCX7568206.1 PAS domain-containing protein [Sulfitobacter sp. F26169L]
MEFDVNVTKYHARWDLKNDQAMAEAIRHARIPLCISDPNLPDNPIVYANLAFCELTGYAEAEVIGKNCRFLQGDATTADSIKAVRAAIDEKKVEIVEIVNYRKDGSSFVNALQIGPIFDDNGDLAFYFGSQLDVTAKRDAERRLRKLADDELVHRLRNIVNVMNVVIRMTAREEKDSDAFGTLVSERLQALSDAHFQTINRPDDHNLSLSDLARTILLAYSPNGAQQFNIDGPDLTLPTHLLSCIALSLHELATNSVKHGALGVETGKVEFDWEIQTAENEHRLRFFWRETGGPEVMKPERRSGSKIVNDLIRSEGGSINFSWEKTGLIVATDLIL